MDRLPLSPLAQKGRMLLAALSKHTTPTLTFHCFPLASMEIPENSWLAGRPFNSLTGLLTGAAPQEPRTAPMLE